MQNGAEKQTAQAPVDLKGGDDTVQFYVQDLSFSMPQRKKLTLEITGGRSHLRVRNKTSQQVEFGVPLDQVRKCRIFIPME